MYKKIPFTLAAVLIVGLFGMVTPTKAQFIPMIQVPNVINMSEDDAVDAIYDKGFYASLTEEYSVTVPEGHVISQTPEAGSWLKVGSIVYLTISKSDGQDHVHFNDPMLKAAVEDELGVTDPTAADMLNLISLNVEPIFDLTGLEYAINLMELDLDSGQISDISPLAGLTNLEYLDLYSNQISDISLLSGLTNLEYLDLYNNQIGDFSPLSGLTNLRWLSLSENKISDVSVLSGLTNLLFLDLEDNQISDISPLSGLTNLELLGLGNNKISDVSPLSEMIFLRELYLDNNKISDISPLSGLAHLDFLVLACNPLKLEAYEVYIPQMEANGIRIWYACSETDIVWTLPATSIDSTSATLIAQVIDDEVWTVRFAYRKYSGAPTYETEPVGGKTYLDLVSMTVDNLLPDTWYLFWAIAENAGGTYEGAELMFRALPGGTEPPETVNVPDVVGMSETDAESAITSAGLEVSHTYEYSDTVPEGNVISQYPSAGSLVSVDSYVDLTVSLGPSGSKTVVVPNVVGMSEDDADSEITSRGLNVSYSYEYSDTVAEGYVISQSPSAGASVPAGSYVVLTVSQYDDVDDGQVGSIVPLLVDGDFDASSDSTALRVNSEDQDWYESRQNVPNLVTLDSTNVGGNATKKAKLTASTFGSAYLTQEFSAQQTRQFAAQWDIYVDSILDRPGSSYDRAAWVLIGDDTGTTSGRTGPNAEDSERFVYLGFYKSGGGTSGTMDLVARQSSVTATTFITVATGLSLKQWYTITVFCDLTQDNYDVYIDGQFQMNVKARTPKSSVTHISFAEWSQNEGAATFYVDNIMAEADLIPACGPFLVDGDFDASSDSKVMRADSADQDWYESRQDDPTLVTLDFTNVGGNATKKAKLTASTDGNAYLTQEFSAPLIQQFAVQWDIYVDSILDRPGSSYDRAAWVFIGDDTGMTPGRTGPNAEDNERFVYLGFYKAGGGTSGTMDLVARESSETATTFITVATGLSLKQWYTITVFCDLTQDNYDVYIDGQFQMNVKARTPKDSVTHISFAEWQQDEGAATFYVDNVMAECVEE